MAKSKEYNGQIVQQEFEKLSLDKQIETYHTLGIWLHQKISNHRTKLAEEDKLFENAQKTLKTE